jgi:hypothetical protein
MKPPFFSVRPCVRALVLLSTPFLLVGCGGITEDRTIYNEVLPQEGLTLVPGEHADLQARANAFDGSVVRMHWFVEHIAGEHGHLSRPIVSDEACQKATFNQVNGEGRGACPTRLRIPATAAPGIWRIGNTASNDQGEQYTQDIRVTVVPSESKGDLRLHIPNGPFLTRLNTVVELGIPVSSISGRPVRDLTYRWTLVSATPNVTLVGADLPNPSFTATVPGEWIVEVVVQGKTGPAASPRLEEVRGQVVVQAHTNLPSEAAWLRMEGPATININQVGLLLGTLEGGGGLRGMRYQWQQVEGPTAWLGNTTSAQGSFMAPVEGFYVFELTAEGETALGVPIRTTGQFGVYAVDPEKE